MLRSWRHRLLRAAAGRLRTKTVTMRNDAPLVSFTFDDVPDSAYVNGAAILEAHGLRGTFYVASGTCGKRDEHWRVILPEQVAKLAAHGHEIGGHTFSHVNVQTLSARGMAAEIAKSAERLRQICGNIPIENFAYPFGDLSLPRKLQLQRHFVSCRGIYEGINIGTVDLGLLKVEPLYGQLADSGAVADLLDDVVHQNGWLIFYTHDVTESPSGIGCTPALLERAVRLAQTRGIVCVTVREGLRRIGYRVAAEADQRAGWAPTSGRKAAHRHQAQAEHGDEHREPDRVATIEQNAFKARQIHAK